MLITLDIIDENGPQTIEIDDQKQGYASSHAGDLKIGEPTPTMIETTLDNFLHSPVYGCGATFHLNDENRKHAYFEKVCREDGTVEIYYSDSEEGIYEID